VLEGVGARDLEKVLAFAEFVKARRAARTTAGRSDVPPGHDDSEKPSQTGAADYEPPSSKQRTAAR
jgi:hypothetical protein